MVETPLAGLSILVVASTLPRPSAPASTALSPADPGHSGPPGGRDELDRLRALGLDLRWARPFVIVETGALGPILDELARFRSMALTSAHAVEALAASLAARGLDAAALRGMRIAALGGATSDALQAFLALRPEVTTSSGGGADLAAAMLAAGVEGPVLFPRAAGGRQELPDALGAHGIEVRTVESYVQDALATQAELQDAVATHRSRPLSAIAFGSPLGVDVFFDEVERTETRIDRALLGSIGRTTAAALLRRAQRVDVVARAPGIARLVLDLVSRLAPSIQIG